MGADQWNWQESSETQQSQNGEQGDDEFHSGAEEDPSDDAWGQSGSQWTGPTGPEDETWTSDGQDLLPDFLQGWYLHP